MDLILNYRCQIGVKPGVPVYSFQVLDRQFEVKKTAVTLKTREVAARGLLDEMDANALAAALEKLRGASFAPAEAKKPAGACAIDAATKRGPVRFNAPESDPAWKDAEPFFDWLRALHAAYPGLKSIRPIFPGTAFAPDY